jgi:voltage-gated potassium channel
VLLRETAKHMQLLSERRLTAISRAVASGRILPFLVLTMLLVTLAATVVVEVFTPNSFSSFGNAAWWAAATVTTVGYGDVVPATSGGRFIAVFVMFAGIASVSIVTALVTSAVVTYQQRRLGADVERHRELVETLARIEQRLDRLEP